MTPGLSLGFSHRSSDFEVKNAFATDRTHPQFPGAGAQPAGHNLTNTRPDDISMVDCGAPLGIGNGAIASFTKSAPRKRSDWLRRSSCRIAKMLHVAVVSRRSAPPGHSSMKPDRTAAVLTTTETGLCEPAQISDRLRIRCGRFLKHRANAD